MASGQVGRALHGCLGAVLLLGAETDLPAWGGGGGELTASATAAAFFAWLVYLRSPLALSPSIFWEWLGDGSVILLQTASTAQAPEAYARLWIPWAKSPAELMPAWGSDLSSTWPSASEFSCSYS